MTAADRSLPPRNRAERRAAARQRRRKGVAIAAGTSLVLTGMHTLVAPSISGAAEPFTVTVGGDGFVYDAEVEGDVPVEGTLRWALYQAGEAAGADTVTFDEGLFDEGAVTITTSSQLSIDHDVAIEGPGADLLTISGDDAHRVLELRYPYSSEEEPGGLITVSISGLTIANGRPDGAPYGGGILAEDTDLTLDDVTLTGNTIGEAGEGAGLWIGGELSSLELVDSIVSGNVAPSGGFNSDGGGIFVSDVGGAVAIQNTHFAENVAGLGGALHIDGGANVTVENSTFSGNDAVHGGAVDMSGSGTVSVMDSTFTGNEASNDGGGIRAAVSGALTISRTTISDNSAGEFGSGGGVDLTMEGGSVEISQSTISDNGARTGGGVSVWDSEEGGGSVEIRQSTISGNGVASGNGAVFAGGGVYLYLEGDTIFELRHSAIVGNSAEYIGGLFLKGGGVVDHSIIADNLHDGEGSLYSVDLDNWGSDAVTVTWSLVEDDEPKNLELAEGSSDNILGEDPLLDELADNGGDTLTHLPLDESPVIDAGDPAIGDDAPDTDQRGYEPRVSGAHIDLGPVEVGADDPTTTTTTTTTTMPAPTTTTTPPTTTPPTTTPPTTTPPPPVLPTRPGGSTQPVFIVEGEVVEVPLPPGMPAGQTFTALAVSPTESIVVTADGQVFSTNPAHNLGSIPPVLRARLRSAVVGMGIHWRRVVAGPAGFEAAATEEWEPSGYWLLGADGGVFSFGTAGFHGSTGAMALNRPVVAMTPTATGLGYWLVAADGGVFAFGDAVFHGSTGDLKLAKPVVSMVPTTSGKGYYLFAADGGVFTFGDARFFGSGAVTGRTYTGAMLSPSGAGYWLLEADGTRHPFGDAG